MNSNENSNNKKKKTLKKRVKLDIKTMGVDIDKNEYREIVLSNTNRPERFY